MPPKKMPQSAFMRFIQANPRMYDIPGQTTSDRWIGQQEIRHEALGEMAQDYDYGMMNGRGANGHGGDAGKLPWHPTYSTQSAFSTQGDPGGIWGEDATGTTFRPMPRQDTEYFRNYMQDVEPNVRIVR